MSDISEAQLRSLLRIVDRARVVIDCLSRLPADKHKASSTNGRLRAAKHALTSAVELYDLFADEPEQTDIDNPTG